MERLSSSSLRGRFAFLPLPSTSTTAPQSALAIAFQQAKANATTQVRETRSLRDFASAVNPRYKWYRHCEILCEVLQAIADDELNRAMVFMPPRHGKTELVSRIFPAYYVRKHPDRWTGLCSYEAGLAQDFSRTARDSFVRSGGKLKGDSQAVNLWQTEERGGMWAAGVGGPITGRGFHLGIIDDPIKNDEEAASETIRRKHKSWYDSTFLTRGEPDHSIVVVQTRWNEDDLSGYLLSQESVEPEGWHIVNLEAIKDDDERQFPVSCTVEPDWREKGQALCPERYNEQDLGKIRNRVGSYFWSALYQQRPSPLEGGSFKRAWWKYYTTLDNPEIEHDGILPQEFSFMCQSWDMTFKETDSSDYVVGQVWGVLGANFYLLDQVRDRMDFPTALAEMRSMAAKWPDAVVKYVEDKANGSAVIATLRQKIPGFVAVNPEGGKESRAHAASPLVEAGNVYLPSPELAPWVRDFVEEHAGFPNAAHDDQVDALTQVLKKIGPMGRVIQEPRVPMVDSDTHPGWNLKQKARNPKWVNPLQRQFNSDKWKTPKMNRPRFDDE